MESKPFNNQPDEALPKGSKDTTSEKNTSKKKTKGESTAAADRKQQAEQRIAQSLDALSLFERPKDKDKASAAPKNETIDAAEPVEQVTEEESQYIEQAVARERLAELEDADEETRQQSVLASDFLERVSNGQPADEAFEEVATEYGIDPAELAAAEMAPDDQLESEDETEVEPSEPARPATAPETPTEAPTEIADDEPVVLRRDPPVAAPVVATPRTPQSPQEAAYQNNRNKAGELLVVGIVGYLIGRRRGRIKIEKRLLPVQQQLEKQVRDLTQSITTKERQLVALGAKHEQTKKLVRTERSTAPAERVQPSRVETRLGMQKPARAEQLGHMVIAAEAPKRAAAARFEGAGNIRAAFRPEEVKTMDRRQILELSEKITIEGASLRHIYESNLIGERQLRHLVSEYLDGKDIRDELRRHMVEHEIDFERDPMIRDRIRGKLKASSQGGGLGQLLADAGLTSDAVAAAKQAQAERDEQQHNTDKQRHQKQRAVADTAMATAIVVLAIAVIILVWKG